MAQQSGSWEGKPARAFLIRVAAFVLPLVFAIFVAWQLTKLLPTPTTWPGMIVWWLLVMASSTMALRIADRFAKRLMPLAVLMKLSLVFPDKAPSRFGVSLKSGSAHSLEELLKRAEQAGKHDDLTDAAETILALGAALNAHDPRTRGHGDRVRAYADMLGEEMGYTDEERNKLKWAAMLHDIGKLRVPSEVINSPGKLTDDEWIIMRNHPDWGMELAAPLLPWLGEFATAIGQHHERFDGNGYPNGVTGEDIGLAARITSVADTYDVMTSVRSYKEARPASEAREELARCAGSQFDPVVVRAFLNISLGRQRWVAGPLSWLAQVPFFQSALQGATTLAQNAAVAAQTGLAATAIGATAVVAPALIDAPNLEPETALPSIVVTANDDALALPEDTSEAVFLLANDDVEVLSLTVLSGPSHGTAIVSPGGTLTYTPDPEFSGTDTLTYEVCGIDGSCDTAVLSISVTAVNDPPDLLAVPASLDEDTSTVIDVLSAVVDIDGDPAAAIVSLVGLADEGLVLPNGDGTFTYTPPPDFSGTDSFTVRICDEGGACELRALSVAVAPINDAPTVEVSLPVIVEDTPASIFVDATDADGDVLTTTVVDGPLSGTAVVDIDGSVFYSPGPDFFGAESITIEVCDPTACVEEVMSFIVADVNDPPVVPGPGPLVTAEETMISFDPLAGATDPEGGILSLDSFDAISANGGSIALGSLEYTPATDFVGIDTFSYAVGDPDGATTSVTVTVTVTGVNDNPFGEDDAFVTAEDTPLLVAVPGVLANDGDVDGDPLTAALESGPTSGAVTVSADGSFNYTPDPDFTGSDGFTYVIDDGVGGSASASVALEVLPVNDAPQAVDDAAATSGPGAVIVAVLANDVDVEGDFDPTSVSVVVPPTKGVAVANPDGTIDYTPTSGETGADSFVYQICDLSALCDNATVTIGLMGPDAVDDAASMAEDAAPITIDVVANDTDPNADLDPTSAVVEVPASNGLATANGDGTFDYDSDLDFEGTDTFEYRVCDLTSACNTATVTIMVTAVNDAPVAGDDGVGVAEDFAPGVTFNVLTNDTDVDLDSLSLDSFDGSSIAGGLLTDNGGGSFTYVPSPNYFGVETFTYQVTDGALTDTGTVTITVTNVPDAPQTQDDAYATDRDLALVVAVPGVLGNDTDYDGDSLTAAVASPPSNGGVALAADGSFTYTPNPGYVGSDSFTYTADDGLNPPVPATVDIVIDDGIVAAGWFFGETGPSPETWLFVASPPPPGNPDPDGDGNPGLTVENSGGGEGESDPLKYQQWLLAPSVSAIELNGPVTLKLWSTVEFYEVDKDIDVTVWIHDCDAAGIVCGPALLNYDVHHDAWNGGVADFVYHELTLGLLNHTVAVGRSLRVRLQFDHEVVWVGVNADHPSEVVFTEANLPPATLPDSDGMLEDGGPLNIDVLANDADPNLDPPSLSVATAPANGTAVVVAGPTIDYDPDPDFFGVDTFIYEICDTSAACSTETVTVTVTSVNDVPSFIVGADEVILEDSGGQTVDPHPTAISAGPANESGQSTSFTVSNDNPALFKNAPVINPAGRLQYEAWGDVSGSATVTVSISDNGGTANGGIDTSADQTFTITVTGVNDQPAFNDGPNVSVDEDTGPHTFAAWASAITAGAPEEEPPAQALTINILTNDNPALFAAGPTVDTATGDLAFTLTPDAFGQANIDINLTDDGGTANGGIDTSVTRSFTIDVDPVNDPPTFLPGGDVVVLEDSGGYSALWASAVTVGPANEASQTPTFAVTGNTNAGLFSAGPVMAADGTLSFTPALDANGSADVTVELSDDGGTANGGLDTSAPSTFTITVTPVNDPPLTVADPNPGVLEGGSVNVDVLANDSDVDLDPLFVGAITGVTNGSVVVEGDETITFNHDGSETVTAAFTYRANDGTVDGNPITITVDVTPVNDAPVAVGDPVVPGDPLFKTVEDETTPVLITAAVLKSNDTDAEGDPLTVETASGASTAGGTYSCNAAGCEYLPPAAFTGSDTFPYTVNDGALSSGPATVNMDVRARTADIELTRIAGPVPDPVDAAVPVAIVYRVDNNGIDHTGGVNFISNLPVSFDFTSATSTKGLCTYDGLLHQVTCDIGSMFPATSENVTLTLTPHTNGPVDVTAWVTASAGDPDVLNNQVTTTVNVVNNPPTGVADTVSVPEDSVDFLIAVLGNDTDPEGNIDPAATSVVGGVSNGTLVNNGDGTFDYTPISDYAGSDSFTYQVCDTVGACDSPVPVSIAVTAVNDAPSFTKGPDQTVLVDSGAQSIVGWATAINPGPADESGQSVTFNTIGNTNPGLFSAPPLVASTGTLVYTPAAGQTGTATITIEAQDDGGTANGGVDTSPSQSFDIVVSQPKVLISEFRLDGPGGAGDEYVEIFNADSAPVAIDGWKLHITSGIDTDFFTFPSFTINPGQHYLVANSGAPPALGADGTWAGLDYGAAFGDVQLVTAGGIQIDAFAYGAGPVLGEGTALPAWLNPSTLDSSWERLNLDPFGSCVDTDDNAADFVFRYGHASPQNRFAAATPCATPAAPTNIVISEVSRRSALSAQDEFIELFNPTAAPIDVSGWTVGVDFPFAPIIPGGTVIPAGGHYLLVGELYAGAAIPDYQVPALGFNWIVGSDLVWVRDALNNLVDVVAINHAGGEGDPLPALSGGFSNYSYERVLGGCYDTNDNANDFTPFPEPGNPQSLTSTLTPCL